MQPDEELIRRAKEAVKDGTGVQGGRERDQVGTIIDDYRAACQLSRGPDDQRAYHWTEKAIDGERQLRRILDREATPAAKAVNRISGDDCGDEDVRLAE